MATTESRVVIVTGAGNGIGLGLARSLLERRFRVAGFDREITRLGEVAQTHPGRMHVCECDLTEDAAVDAAVAEVIDRWDRIDVLVNNACMAVFRPFDEAGRIDHIRREFEVDFYGYLRMIQAVLPRMKSQGEGVIHNVGSGVGLTGFPGLSGYASAKGAVEALTRTLAFEFEKFGVTVNLIHPPLTNTASASPLGIPAQMMSDPDRVGRALAKRIGSRSPVITPDWKTGVGLFINRHFPGLIGRLMVRQTSRVQSSARRDARPENGSG